MSKKNIGGVSLTKKWKDVPKQEVLDYFLQNSDFKILTDSSVSCITYVVTLDEDKESPFFFVRSQLFQQPVRNMLMKVCIYNTENDPMPDFRNNNSNKNIETMSAENIKKEVIIQDELFRKSYIENVAEPICPAILYVQTDIVRENLQEKYHKWIIPKLVERNGSKTPDRDHYITNYLFNNHRLSVIFMELADGYTTLFELWNVLKNQRDGPILLERYLCIAMYELYRLYHTYGIVHGDIHFGNILVNPSYPYLSNDKPGKILIIDFGKSFYESPDQNKGEYDTVIYHKNTNDFINILAHITNKNEVFKNTYNQYQELRNVNIQCFLDKLFEGSLEKWRDWSNHNIHYPYTEYLVGGLYHPQKQKKHNINETKRNQDNNKMNFLVSPTGQEDTASYSARKPGCDHLYVTNDLYITQKMMEDFLTDLRETRKNLEKNPPKVEPLSPRSANKIKNLMAEELNRPLEIEDYSKKTESTILSSSDVNKKTKNRTRSKRNT